MSDTEPSQTVVREPAETDVGPHFPSGMNSVEAALSGATAGMTDEQLESLEATRAIEEQTPSE